MYLKKLLNTYFYHEKLNFSCVLSGVYLNLHLEVDLEGLEEREKDGERELHHLRNTGHPVLRQRHTQVLLHRSDEHFLRLEGLRGGKGAREVVTTRSP